MISSTDIVMIRLSKIKNLTNEVSDNDDIVFFDIEMDDAMIADETKCLQDL